ncbi:hypothetical protein HDU67_009186 [Dinochytrium kinnereticum]|nr:hypothetical protein HDU67_009186 [Dinochytrium kinnereticum]
MQALHSTPSSLDLVSSSSAATTCSVRIQDIDPLSDDTEDSTVDLELGLGPHAAKAGVARARRKSKHKVHHSRPIQQPSIVTTRRKSAAVSDFVDPLADLSAYETMFPEPIVVTSPPKAQHQLRNPAAKSQSSSLQPTPQPKAVPKQVNQHDSVPAIAVGREPIPVGESPPHQLRDSGMGKEDLGSLSTSISGLSSIMMAHSDRGLKPLSVCSFNTFLLPSLFAPATSAALSSTLDKTGVGGIKHSTATRSERIADFCRGMHVCLLQEVGYGFPSQISLPVISGHLKSLGTLVWGPGVDALTAALSSTHSIPPSLKSTTKLSLLADTFNTIAFFLSATGGLWVAYSRADGWRAGEEFDEAHNFRPKSAPQRPRYPPTKRPEPHLNLFPIPLTVPSSRTFTVSATRSRKGIRAILLDASEFWGKGKRLLCFNTHLDAHDMAKRGRQLKEIASYVREVILSLSSLAFDTPLSPTSRKSTTDDHLSDDFDMLDEYANIHSRHPPISPPTSPTIDAPPPPTSDAAAVRYALAPLSPPPFLHHLITIASDTAVLIAGNLNVTAGTNEYREALLGLMGPTSPRLVDHFAGVPGESEESKRRTGNGVATFDPLRNSMVNLEASVGSIGRKSDLGLRSGPARLDYIFGMEGVDVGGGTVVQFLKLRKVSGEVMDKEDMSDHWPVIAYFVPDDP